MKKYLSVLAGIILLASCNTKPDPAVTCFLEGKVLPVYDEYLALTIGEFLDSAKIEDDGSFSMEVPLTVKGSGILMYNNALVELWLEPSKKLQLNVNSNTFPDKIEYLDELGPINYYMQLSRKLKARTEKSTEALYAMEPDDFAQFVDSIRLQKEKLLDEYVSRYPDFDSAYANQEKTDITYTWGMQKMQYPGYYALIKNQIPGLPDNYHQDYMEKLEINNAGLLDNPVYKLFLENYLDYKEAIYLDNNPEVEKLWFPGSVARFRVIHEEFNNEDIKNYLLYRSMSDHLDDYGIEHVETFITNFRIACTNEEYKAEVEKKYTVNEDLARGKPAPELTFFDRDGEKVKLSDFNGKLLYLNFWASWSEWSIQEFPYWEKLRNDFDGYEIEFIAVSMDFSTDRNKWEYILEKENLEGTHLLHDAQSEAFVDKYFIDELPRYLLIDKDGNMISAHAPRPSENMDAVIKSLLKE